VDPNFGTSVLLEIYTRQRNLYTIKFRDLNFWTSFDGNICVKYFITDVHKLHWFIQGWV